MHFRSLMIAVLAVAAAAVSIAQNPAAAASAHPWMDTSLSPDQRAALVLKELTLDEKIQLVHGVGWGPLRDGSPIPPDNNGGAGEVLGIPRLGIPSLQQADSAVGVRMSAPEGRYSTLLPSVLGAAASWDPEAALLYGNVIGRELRAQGYNQSIGGGVDLARDPRNGRLFEYPGEDPVLAGVTVGHVIKGIESNHIMGDIKHYALNDQETGRTIVDVHIDKKAMRESDLLAFEIGIRIGNPSSVMCAYNKVNGDWSCENDYLLNHVLKGNWHYPGFVVSDWDATHTTVKAAKAGLDMQMPGQEYFGPALKKAVQTGQVPQARLDDMVLRLLRSMFAAGVIDDPPAPRFVVDPFKGRDDAQHIAEESLVLLRNQDILPLDASKFHSIAVIGAHADKGILSGGGSAQVDAPGGNVLSPRRPTTWAEPVYFPSAPLKYIRELAPDADVQFDEGTDPASAAALAKRSDIAIVFADQYMHEGSDSHTLALPNRQDALIQAVAAANPHTVVVLVTGNPVSMPWVNDVAAVMEAWYPGIAGGQVIANILFGKVNPSGKLPITFAKSEADLPHPKVFGLTDDMNDEESVARHYKNAGFPAELTEGTRFGYKWFDSENKQPLFPFGFGLSYTTYKYANLQVNAKQKTVTFTIENSGKRAGTEIAELYVQLPSESNEHFRRLAGWQRVSLKPGEQKTVTIAIEPLAMATFDTTKDDWTWLSGDYTFSLGGSSRDLPLVVKSPLQ